MSASLPSILLPGTDLPIARIGLGAMPLSLSGRPDRETAKAVVKRAVELGVTVIDTADVYALDDTELGHNERLVAEALGEMGVSAEGDPHASVVVATKGGMTRPGGGWHRDGRPEHLREACHASLRALGVERIALYQLHSPDPDVPFAESVGTLAGLQEEGKVAAVGLSNVSVAQIAEAQEIVGIATVQDALSPLDLAHLRADVVEHCEQEGIVFLAYSPLGGSGRVGLLDESDALTDLSAELGASPQELALAWLLAYSPAVVPIPGATRVASVESSVRAAQIALDEQPKHRVEEAFKSFGQPGGLLERVVSRVARTFRP